MPESLLNRRLKLGTYAGIPLFVHWSFALAILYVALSAAHSGLGMAGIAFSIAQLIGVFVCVTLHEYGHAMAAKCFGIATADITLLPIGGVARLKKMPRIPWQELIVAVAGPAVNVVIATVLSVVLFATTDPELLKAVGTYANFIILQGPITDETLMMLMDFLSQPSWVGFGLLLLVVNMVLVLFNLIPAFPMDGGRVFRAVMAMMIDYRRATLIASRLGVVIAVFMAITALRSDPPRLIPLFIAAFIAYAGLAEARQVDLMESVRGLFVRQVMISQPPSISMALTLDQIVQQWKQIPLRSVPVVSMAGTVVGMLSMKDVARKIKAGISGTTVAGELVDHSQDFGPVRVDERLEDAIVHSGKHHRQIPVVNETGLLVGLLDLDTMISRSSMLQAGADLGGVENAITGQQPSKDNLSESPLRFDASS